MQLTPQNVFHYLSRRQLINESEVIKGNFLVQPEETRNNILKIKINQFDSIFIKQMAKDNAANQLIQREINAYQLFRKDKKFIELEKSVPTLLDFDKENNVLITNLFQNSMSVHDYYMRKKDFSMTLAREQATILSSCHRVNISDVNTTIFPKLLPWVLQLDKYEAHQYFPNKPLSTKIIGIIKENALLQTELLKLSNEWKYSHLIHGDVKWINFLIIEEKGQQSQRLIDWELTDVGDPLWDVAGLLQSYIVAWIFGFDNNKKGHHLPETMLPFHIHNTQKSASAFLDQYLNLQELTYSQKHKFLEKIMRYTAARILQTSIEGVNFNAEIESNNIRCIQLAYNIFKDPMKALGELFHIQQNQMNYD